MQFDAVRVDGEEGRRLADWMELLTGGDPGPVVMEANGRRGVYFLVPPGTTAYKAWPRGVTRFNAGRAHVSYVPVPALKGRTWPLSWRFPPTGSGRFVHPLLLRSAVTALFSTA
ncbi:hypothetical protein [Streptomyces sp. NPDC093089]|uniref:hypothetical protein n=1 Tax=Streptomyces sp. NPDC093089 TaxID=3366024 RepID=UPI00382C76F3